MSRTRGILGGTSLVAAGVPNEVCVLWNGTRGWLLEGLALERGATRFATTPSPHARERAMALTGMWTVAVLTTGVASLEALCLLTRRGQVARGDHARTVAVGVAMLPQGLDV